MLCFSLFICIEQEIKKINCLLSLLFFFFFLIFDFFFVITIFVILCGISDFVIISFNFTHTRSFNYTSKSHVNKQ